MKNEKPFQEDKAQKTFDEIYVDELRMEMAREITGDLPDEITEETIDEKALRASKKRKAEERISKDDTWR